VGLSNLLRVCDIPSRRVCRARHSNLVRVWHFDLVGGGGIPIWCEWWRCVAFQVGECVGEGHDEGVMHSNSVRVSVFQSSESVGHSNLARFQSGGTFQFGGVFGEVSVCGHSNR
jgi:hypothetical protein